MRKSDIQKRLLNLFFLIILPVILLGIGGELYTYRKSEESILASITDRIQIDAFHMNDSFQATATQTATLLSKARVNRTANPDYPMNNYERCENVNWIRDYLDSIKLSCSFVNNVRIYFPRMNICYNATNVYDYQLGRILGSQNDMAAEEYEELLALQNLSGHIRIHNENLVFLQYSSAKQPQHIIEAVYAPEVLKEYLEKMLVYQDAYYYFLTDYDTFQLTNCEDEILNGQIKALESDAVTTIKSGGKKYYVFSYDIPAADARYIQVIPARLMLMNPSMSLYYSVIFSLAVVICMVIIVTGSLRIIRGPIARLNEAFHQIEERKFDTRIGTPVVSDFQYLYQSFDSMARHLDTLIQKELKHELLLQQSQLKQLQAQINPHFLYNSFFTLNQMISRDMNESAKELTRELGIYFRYVTRSDSSETTLFQEYQHALVYSKIQETRFAGRIRMELDDLPDEYASVPVPRLILQPILENCFQHGLHDKIQDGLIRVTFHLKDGTLQIHIEDNGEALTEDRLSQLSGNLKSVQGSNYTGETTGILNICRRLQLYYQQKDCVRVSRSMLGGLLVVITIRRKE